MKMILKSPLCIIAITTICLIIVTLFAATSCEKPDEDNFYIYANKVENVYAKVENTSEYSNIIEVKLMMWDIHKRRYIELARGDWKDGGSTILLPIIDSNNLRSLVSHRILPTMITDISPNINVSNIDARTGFAEFWGIDKDGKEIVQFFLNKIDEVGNIGTSFFKYADSDVTISGYIEKGTAATDFDEYSEYTSTWIWKSLTIYSIKMQKGWNISSSFHSQPKGTITDKWSAIPICSEK